VYQAELSGHPVIGSSGHGCGLPDDQMIDDQMIDDPMIDDPMV
jgi:hypothetical protein